MDSDKNIVPCVQCGRMKEVNSPRGYLCIWCVAEYVNENSAERIFNNLIKEKQVDQQETNETIGERANSQLQRTEMRKAFFAGAQHLFGSIMSFLEEGSEPTAKDLDRMTLIHRELEEFVKELKEATFS